MSDTTGKTCKYCGPVLATRKSTNHVLHLCLSVVTFGCWLLVWMVLPLLKGKWRCTKCGSDEVSYLTTDTQRIMARAGGWMRRKDLQAEVED